MLPSASKIDLARRCMGSVKLPGVRESSEAASAGSVIHAYLENAAHDRAAALRAVPEEYQERCEAIDLGRIPRGCEREVAMGFDPTSGRAVRYRLDAHRNYPADGLYHGTADLVGMVSSGVVYVGDFKTGWNRIRAKDSAQLRALAVMAARISGASEARVELLYEREGEWLTDAATLDAIDLDEAAEELVELAEDLEVVGNPPLHVGAHCTYCPALRLCPAQTTLVRAFGEADTEGLVALSPEEAGAFYARTLAVEAALDRAKATLRAIAEQMPDGLPLPDGRTLKRCNWTTQHKDADAKARLAELTETLIAEGHITKRTTGQVRVVGRVK